MLLGKTVQEGLRIPEIRMRLSERDFQLLVRKADELELLPTVYARSLMLRHLRVDTIRHHYKGKGEA